MTLSIYLAEIKARIAKATPGPWEEHLPLSREENPGLIYSSALHCSGEWIADCGNNSEDADFIAHSRLDIEKLVKIVEVMQEGLEVDTLAAVDKILEEK